MNLIIPLLLLTFIIIYYSCFRPVPRIRNMKTKYKSSKKNKNYTTEIQAEEKRLKKTKLTPKQKVIIHTKLGELYRDGIPDKYDMYNNKIKGVEPNGQKSLNHFQIAHQKGSLKAGIEIGKLYHYGMHKFEPNLAKAKSIYEKFIYRTLDNQMRLTLRELIDDVNAKIIAARLPPTQILHAIPQNPIQIIPTNPFTIAPPLMVERPNLHLNVLPVPAYPLPDPVEPINIEQDNHAPAPARQNYRNDTQNVHDSTVIRTIKNSIQKLKEVCSIRKKPEESIREIREMLNKLEENDKKKDALQTLNAIERSTEQLSFSKMKEIDLLNLVWNRIHDDCHTTNKENLKTNLVNELAESIEYGRPVCSTGRFNRVLDTLNSVDPLVTILPTDAINNEMMTTASKIRTDLFNEYNPEEQKNIDSDEPNFIQQQFDTLLKNRIRTTFRENYVEQNILTQEKMDSMIEPWIDYL